MGHGDCVLPDRLLHSRCVLRGLTDCSSAHVRFGNTDLCSWQQEVSTVENAFKQGLFQEFIANLKVKNEEYQGQSKTKVVGLSLAKLDHVDESKKLLEAIKMYD